MDGTCRSRLVEDKFGKETLNLRLLPTWGVYLDICLVYTCVTWVRCGVYYVYFEKKSSAPFVGFNEELVIQAFHST